MPFKYLKTYGTKDFHGSVDITDPCYNHDVWCRMNNVKIADGTYTCIAYASKRWYQDDRDVSLGRPSKRIYYDFIDSIGIFHSKKVGDNIDTIRKSMEYIGDIGVDAGLAGFFHNKPDYDDAAWHAFCDSVPPKRDAWLRDEGFFSTSGGGDGCYEVFAARDPNTNEIIALEICFTDACYSK